MSIENKVAVVSGASRGIGKAIALELARRGAVVAGTATTEEGARSISDYLSQAGARGRGYQLDVVSEESVETFAGQVQTDFGVPEILVNNAGITRDNLMLRMKPEEWQSVIETNLGSVFRMSRVLLRGMTRARWGRIISISSVVGSSGNPGQSNYAASKAGVEGFTRALAIEIGSRGITVNAVAPGYVWTPLVERQVPDTARARGISEAEVKRNVLLAAQPTKEFVTVEQVAALALFLAGDQAASITGAVLPIDGGWTAQ